MGRGKKSVAAMARDYERLKARLLKLGPVAQGSILARKVVREDPQMAGQLKEYGPYYQWTRKIGGRTVNMNLSPEQAKTFGRAIAQHRRMEATLDRMRELSLKLLEESAVGVKKRKPRKSNDVTLS